MLAGVIYSASAQAEESFNYVMQENLVYKNEHGIGCVLDVFVPKGSRNGLGIIHAMNGGYYSHDEMREHFRKDFKIYDRFCSHGYTVFSIRTGSCTKFTIEEMVANLKTGIRWVKSHAEEYKIDPDALGLTGASAGGNLALLAMVHEEAGEPDSEDPLKRHSTRVAAAGFFFPPTDWLNEEGKLSPFAEEYFKKLAFMSEYDGISEEMVLRKAAELSPARQVKSKLPPVIFYHGDEDGLPIDHSTKMVEALRKAGGQAELVTMKGYGHTWPGIDKEVGQVADWFDRQLSATPARVMKEDKSVNNSMQTPLHSLTE